jgi:hypothetical protein
MWGTAKLLSRASAGHKKITMKTSAEVGRNLRGTGMEPSRKGSRSLLCAAIGILFAGIAISGSTTPASAQAANAEQLCTPDVMRLCNEFIPNPGPIVRCLKAKRRQLSPGCHAALSGGGKGKSSKRKRVAKRR